METKFIIWPVNYKKNLKSANSRDDNLPDELVQWGDIIDLWRQIMKLAVRKPVDIQKSIEQFSSDCLKGHNDYINLLASWSDCLKQIAEASLSVRDDDFNKGELLKISIHSYREFFETLQNTRYQYSSGLIKAYFKYLQLFNHEDNDLTETIIKKK
jgi:hypothetical protein